MVLQSAVRRMKGDDVTEVTGTSGQRIGDGLTDTGAALSRNKGPCRYPGVGVGTIAPWETLSARAGRPEPVEVDEEQGGREVPAQGWA